MTTTELRTPENPSIYATVDGYVTPSGYGYYNQDAHIHLCDNLDEARSWVTQNAPPGHQLDELIATNRSDHPLGWFSLEGQPPDAHTIAQAVILGFVTNIRITVHRPGSQTDYENTWVSIDDPIYVPKWSTN